MDFYELREKYIGEELDISNVPANNPYTLFQKWYNQAREVNIYEPNAFVLATAAKNAPSARMLLLKDFNDLGFSFFTNYESRKANELAENPNAAMVFFWSELERQVRIVGKAEKLGPEVSDQYFQTRPVGSRLGAWASPQSKEIEDREWLIEKHNEFREKFKHGEIPRPQNWGGYFLKPFSIEFWQGRINRLHDRIEYCFLNDSWHIRRLAP